MFWRFVALKQLWTPNDSKCSQSTVGSAEHWVQIRMEIVSTINMLLNSFANLRLSQPFLILIYPYDAMIHFHFESNRLYNLMLISKCVLES